jgi:D-threo-aldose 1-dehydrogenase
MIFAMEQIDLGTTGRKTTRLGFGCSSLMGAMGRKESLAMLDAAFDAGVRHIDVAPMYGFGQAESCVGEFLSHHRGEVTVTTKYGIPPAKRQGLISLARSVTRPIVKALPGLKSRFIGIASKATQPVDKASFTASEAKESLHRSLKELRTERIDVWLLHEVEVDDLQDQGLLRMLEDCVATGTIGTFGVGSERARAEALAAAQPAYCPVVQFEWSVLDAPVTAIKSFKIHHRSLTHHFRTLKEQLRGDRTTAARWSQEVGVDIGEGDVLPSLMLKAALVENPDSLILVSSKDPDHIRHNVAVAEDRTLDIPARRFYELVRREVASPGQVSMQVAR